MWPFKKKAPEPDPAWVLINQLRDWRDIGDEFEYLGRRMIVTSHYGTAGSHHMGHYILPGIHADYVDDTGVIRSIIFDEAESAALMIHKCRTTWKGGNEPPEDGRRRGTNHD